MRSLALLLALATLLATLGCQSGPLIVSDVSVVVTETLRPNAVIRIQLSN